MTNEISLKAKILQIISENVSNEKFLKEFVTFDPDMEKDDGNIMPSTGIVHVNGIDIPVKYENDNDYKTYYFPEELGNYLIGTCHNDKEAVYKLADFYLDPDNEFGYILDKTNANGKDLLVIKTDSFRDVKLRLNDIFDTARSKDYIAQRAQRNQSQEVANEAVEDEDWMMIWKNSQNKKEDENFIDYVKRLRDSY